MLRHPRTRNPAVKPADTGNTLRLRLAQTLEMAIDDLVERHLRVAGHALRMFVSLRPHATDEQAKQSAIRRAGVVFHLNTSPAQDSPVPGQRPARPPEPGSRSPRLAPGGRAEGGPARQAAAASSTRSPARSATRAQSRLPARPEGTSPPAGWAPAADHQPSRSEGGAGHAAQPRRPQQARGQR